MAKTAQESFCFARRAERRVEVMLVHPGGPFWAKKDAGSWSIPKGLADEGEDLLAAAKREFLEETGMTIEGECLDLGRHKQPGGKTIAAWACEGDFDTTALRSNTFSLEWPPRSGKTAEFPEVDKAAWRSIDEALEKISKGQMSILAALVKRLEAEARGPRQSRTDAAGAWAEDMATASPGAGAITSCFLINSCPIP